MKNTWQVEINHEGNLFIRAKETLDAIENLFGHREMEAGLCIYAHELRSVRALLCRLFPNATLASLDAIEGIIREEFCENRSLNDFRCFLENARIPYRAYSVVA